jgi:hypothetical protein
MRAFSMCSQPGGGGIRRSAGGSKAPRRSDAGASDVLRSARIHDALSTPGNTMEGETRSFMEARFGRDFGDVRIHRDARAGGSARELSAAAHTLGSHIAFADGQFQPEAAAGRRLLAHELAHVVQQGGAGTPAPRPLPPVQIRNTAPAVIQRADIQAVQLTTNLGRTRGTGVQYWPTNVTDTVVGPVSAAGGLAGGGVNQLHVIIGANLTLSALAAELLPLWLTATPFTPPGAAAPLPLDIITQDELARALVVYNQTYLPVPAMTNWRAGLRFPLPAEVNTGTGVTTLHPLQIRNLATAFDPAWAPLLQRGATAVVAQPAAAVTAAVTAFLAAVPSASGRGIQLAARALTDASAELPFIHEAFAQLGAAGFDVALGFMDNLVNLEIQRLASQRDGAAALALVRAALGAAPAPLTAEQQSSLARANLMLGLVAGAPTAAPPAATRSHPERTLTVDTVKLDGSNHNPATDIAIANAIYAQCNVRIAHGVDATATNAETGAWIGANRDLAADPICAVSSPEVARLVTRATARFGLAARIRVFYPRTFSLAAGRGFSWPSSCGPVASKRNTAIIQNTGTERTLAHELGHILLNPGPHQLPATRNVMVPTSQSPLAETFTNADCATIHARV